MMEKRHFSISGVSARRLLQALAVLLAALELPLAIAQEESGDRAFEGPTLHDGAEGFGPDSVDLFQLGLSVTQELSPPLSANGLPYQVKTYYSGTAWSSAWRWQAKGRNSYISPATAWGPLGVGWTVHMGKVLSSGWVDVGGNQAAFHDTRCPSQDTSLRNLTNVIVEPTGLQHPMTVLCGYPNYSVDNSWIVADLGEWGTRCHGMRSWRTPDGTLHEVDKEGLVTKITDLNGNWISMDYYDSDTEFPGGCADPSWKG